MSKQCYTRLSAEDRESGPNRLRKNPSCMRLISLKFYSEHSRSPSSLGWSPTVGVCCGPWCARRDLVGSCRSFHEIAHPHQVVHGRCEGEQPADSLHTAQFDLPDQPDRLQPAEDLFDPFPLLLTHGIAGMAGGPSINRTGTVDRVLGHMGRDLQCPQILDERLRSSCRRPPSPAVGPGARGAGPAPPPVLQSLSPG